MDTETKVYINNDLDIALARMQARDAAKKMGFSTADQARISLAASELARVLSWESHGPSELTISNTSRNGHQGLQVVCVVQREYITAQGVETSVPNKSFAGACRLVDESNVDVQDEKQALVTLIKWLN